MTHVFIIDILTGNEEVDNLHLILKIFLLHIYRKPMHTPKTCTDNYESKAYFPTKFVKIIISETILVLILVYLRIRERRHYVFDCSGRNLTG